MRSLGSVLIPYAWGPYRKRSGHRHTLRDEDSGRRQPSTHLGARPRGGTSPAHTWRSQTPASRTKRNKCVLFKLSCLCICPGQSGILLSNSDKFTCQIPNPQEPRMWLCLEMRVFQEEDEGEIMSPGWVLSPQGWGLYEKRSDTDTSRGMMGIYMPRREALGATSPAHTWTSDFNLQDQEISNT